MPKLEIINSKFTVKAADWAMIFYAKDQEVTKVEDIRALDLSCKGLLHINDISIFERMTSLLTLDISDHPEFLMTDEQMHEEESKLKEGSAEHDKIEFNKRLHSIDDLLTAFKSVKHLTCDDDLETYIIENRATKGFLTSLKDVNGVSIKITEHAKREKER